MTISELKVGTRVTGKSHASFGSQKMGDKLTGTVEKMYQAGPGDTDVYVRWDNGSAESMGASELSISKTAAPASDMQARKGSAGVGVSSTLPAPGVGNYNNDTATVAAVQKKLAEGAVQSAAMVKSVGTKNLAAFGIDAKTVALIGKLDPKRTDGVFDENTANALKAAQQMGGVPATGIIDDWVLAGMEIPKPKSSGSFAAFMTKKYASVPVYGWAVIGTVVVISAGYFIKKGKR